MKLEHTAEEALSRFTLVEGSGNGQDTACAMTALAWMAGEEWTSRPKCAHPLLAKWVINFSDRPGTTESERAAIVRAGVDAILDTWWVPNQVILAAWANTPNDVMSILNYVASWKAANPKVDPCLAEANLSGLTLEYINLTKMDLTGVNFSTTHFVSVGLQDGIMNDANFEEAYLQDTNFNGASLSNANFSKAVFYSTLLCKTNLTGANFRNADLRGSYLIGAYLYDADFGGADLRDVSFRGANLHQANFQGANLNGADFREGDSWNFWS